MCHAKKCRTCGKTTWAGCGQHIAQVKAHVPAAQWCPGHTEPEIKNRTTSQGSGLLGRLLGK